MRLVEAKSSTKMSTNTSEPSSTEKHALGRIWMATMADFSACLRPNRNAFWQGGYPHTRFEIQVLQAKLGRTLPAEEMTILKRYLIVNDDFNNPEKAHIKSLGLPVKN